jgi:S-adenosylmethionine-dependent methyltransferase
MPISNTMGGKVAPSSDNFDSLSCKTELVPQDAWANLADPFVEGAYASVKGRVRTFVLHQQLLRHGAAHQSLPLARIGYDVTVLDPSPAMLAKADVRVRAEPVDVRRRVRLLEAAGEDADTASGGELFSAVMCHGVLMYLEDPEPVLSALCRCVEPGGLVSIMALSADTLAIRPAIDQRWTDALAAFDATSEVGVLGTLTRADTVEGLSQLLIRGGVQLEAWYGVWLFTDWMDLSIETTDVAAVAEVELQASLRDPYRQLSRVFHLVGRKRTT